MGAERSLPYHRRPLCVSLRDREGRALGGITGSTDWGWLSVGRGCCRARLFTDAFQAQAFHERHGCAAFGVLEDDPPGHRQVWMRKDLGA